MAYLKTQQGFVSDALNAPIGTKMIFNQTSSPLGWTKSTSSDDVSLRLVSGTVGTGGTVAFETCFAAVTPTISQPSASSGSVTSHNLATNEMPSHTHNIGIGTGLPGHTGGAIVAGQGGVVNNKNTNAQGGGAVHAHSFNNPTISTPTSSAIDLNVAFVDVIIATKH